MAESNIEKEVPLFDRPKLNVILAIIFAISLGIVTMASLVGVSLPDAISPDLNTVRMVYLQFLLTVPTVFASWRFSYGNSRRS